MDKAVEALGPWPILQLLLGLAVLAVGLFALIKGMTAPKGNNLDEARQEWEAYQQLKAIEQHTKAIAMNQKLMLDRINQSSEAVKQLTEAVRHLVTVLNTLQDVLWNRTQ